MPITISVGSVSGSPSGTVPNSPSSTQQWLVEQQNLNIEYWRIPNDYYNWAAGVELSAIEDVTLNVANTVLVCRVDANYRRQKVVGSFSSAYQHTQTFDYSATLDGGLSGVSNYGNTSSLNASGALGTHGYIYSTRPWYLRRLWNDTTDSEVTRNITVWSKPDKIWLNSSNPWSWEANDYSQYLRFSPGNSMGAPPKNVGWIHNVDGVHKYVETMIGNYAPSADAAGADVRVIVYMANKLSDLDLWSNVVWDPDLAHQGGLHTASGISEYKEWRHEY